MVRSLKNPNLIFFIIAVLYVLISLYRLSAVPPPWYDEIIHLNAASHVAGEGKIWCDFYIPKFEKGVLFNGMPLHWLLLGAYVKVFGISLAGARFFYVLLSLLTLFGSYGLAKKMFGGKTALYAAISLASCYIFFHNSRQIMPQVPAASFSVMAVFVFYLAVEKRTNGLFILSGALTSLAYLSHPTGAAIFFIISLFFFYKKIPARSYIPYLAGIFITILPYIVYITANLQQYLYQTGFIVKGLYPKQNIFLNILDEIPVRYFGLPPIKHIFIQKAVDGRIYNDYFYSLIWFVTHADLRSYFCELASRVPFILSLAYLGFKREKTGPRKDILVISALFIALMSIHPNKFGPYIYMVTPYLAICLAASYFDCMNTGVFSRKIDVRRALALLIMAVFLSSNMILIYRDFATKKIPDYDGFIRQVSKDVPGGSTVAAPVYFWLGMHKDYAFISANQIIYEIDRIMREEKNGSEFRSLSVGEQDAVVRKALAAHNVRYAFITVHLWDRITEVPDLARGAGSALRRYLFYNADKTADYLHDNFYEDEPYARRFEDEVYGLRPGRSEFFNVSDEYRKSLKVYRVR